MQKLNRILIELQPIAPARQTLQLHIIADCTRETDASIAPGGRTDGHFFNFDNFY